MNAGRKPIEDRTRIKLNASWEINYWCSTLNCTPQQLREAVARAGTAVEAVRQELNKVHRY